MSRYEKAYRRGFSDGCSAAGAKYSRSSDEGSRAAWICFAVSMCACTAFAIAASIVNLFGLA